MFDLAIMHLWAPKLRFPYAVRQAWEEKGRMIAHFEERLLCCMLFKGLDGLRFYAKKGDRPSYDFMKNHLLSLMK